MYLFLLSCEFLYTIFLYRLWSRADAPPYFFLPPRSSTFSPLRAKAVDARFYMSLVFSLSHRYEQPYVSTLSTTRTTDPTLFFLSRDIFVNFLFCQNILYLKYVRLDFLYLLFVSNSFTLYLLSGEKLCSAGLPNLASAVVERIATPVDTTLVTSKFERTIPKIQKHESPPARECVDFKPILPRVPDPRLDLRSQSSNFFASDVIRVIARHVIRQRSN